jgi:hypothetical protein
MPANRLYSIGRNSSRVCAALITCLTVVTPTLVRAQDEAADSSAAVAPASNSVTPQEAMETQGTVARAIFTSGIVDREPIDQLDTISTDLPRVYFFTDLRGLAGQIVTHRWEYNGQVMAEVKFKVGEGPRWRVYSSKNLLPEWTGEWTVVVSDESGRPLKSSIFEYSATAKSETETNN